MQSTIRNRFYVLILFAACIFGCGADSWKVTELASPAGNDSGEPFLSTGKDGIWMSWLEKTSQGHSLKIARWNDGWSKPETVTSGDSFFVNWADFPSILPLSEKRLVSHWLEKKGDGKYAYFVMTSISEDMGKTWSRPMAAHTDTTLNEHGFASLIDNGGGNYSIVWLDSRNFAGHHDSKNAMALMYSKVGPNQSRNEITLDPKVCDCCQTAAVPTNDGFLVAYRDRSENEIRDISFIRFSHNQWSQPQVLNADGWHIEGCPVNGPAVDSNGDIVAVAWYTGANDQGRVRIAFSKNNGESFDKPMQVDDGNPSGRVDVVLLDDGSAVVIWLENSNKASADLRIKQFFADGRVGKKLTVADTTQARASGFPRLARFGKNLLIAWTYTAEPSRIRVVRIKV